MKISIHYIEKPSALRSGRLAKLRQNKSYLVIEFDAAEEAVVFPENKVDLIIVGHDLADEDMSGADLVADLCDDASGNLILFLGMRDEVLKDIDNERIFFLSEDAGPHLVDSMVKRILKKKCYN